jgi:thiol-disulfide isomerase/thioredoxin
MRTAILALLCGAAFLVSGADAPARPSPPFSILRVGAPPQQLSQYKGKVVLLAFISTVCPHCQQLTGELAPLAKEYGPRGVQFLEVAFNDGAEANLKDFVAKYQPGFPVGWSTHAAVMSYLGISLLDTHPLYVPHLVFLDRAGMIRADYPGESPFLLNPVPNIRAELDKLLKAGTAATSAPKQAARFSHP